MAVLTSGHANLFHPRKETHGRLRRCAVWIYRGMIVLGALVVVVMVADIIDVIPPCYWYGLKC